MLAYLVDTAPDDNGTLLVTCPAFPEVTTDARNESEVAGNAVAAIEEAIAARIADGEEIPRAATSSELKKHRGPWVKLPVLTSLKVMLYTTLRESGMTRADLARKLGCHREQVDRLFRLDHASKLDRIETAFKALDRDIDIRVRG